jgi:autoinducer 2 (AI-2) kinase
MGGRFLVGLDLGGGGVRCLVADAESGRCASAARPVAARPGPDAPMSAVFEPGEVWAQAVAAAREALASAGAAPDSVAGIATTSMRHGSALLDAAGHELLLASNRDARGLATMLELAAESGAELHRRTGHWPNPVQPAGRLRWIAREAPELAGRVASALALSDWLAFRLCGELAAEPTQAGETLLFEVDRPQWAPDLIERLGLRASWFPPTRAPGSRLGALARPAAEALGLRPGTPVAVGGADTQCGLLGAGVLEPGALAAVAGTSAPVLQVQPGPRLDPSARLWTVHHLLPGLHALESNAGGMGEALDWIAGLLFADASHPVLHLLAEAAASPPGAAGMLSSLGAEVMDARRISLPIGHWTASWLATAGDPRRRGHFARAVLEGMAFALRANVEQIEAVSGRTAPALRLAGGMSRSTLFAEIASGVLGRPVEVAAVCETSALGAAICAGVAAGVFRDLGEGAAALARVARTHAPAPERAALYAERFAGWEELRAARAESDARAAGLALRGLAAAAANAGAPRPAAFRPRILATADLDPEGLAALRRLGDVEYASYREAMRLLTGPSLAEALRGVHALVTEVDVVDAAALLDAPDLRVVVACRGDAVNIDLEACTALGIPVLHTPGRNADAVADLTLAFLLALARRLVDANAFLREPGGEAGDMGRMGRAFRRLQGRELWGSTVGLVGLGAVGGKVLERLRAFGARCLVHDPYLDPDSIRLAGAEPAALDRLLAESDFVSLHATLSDATRGLIGAAELARMRRGSCLVNTARAGLVDEAALREALAAGHLAGAALDVFAVEPPAPDDPLLALPQVIATPHVGGNTREVAAHQGRIAAEELGRLLRGEPPRHCLNPAVLRGLDLARPRPAPAAELRARLGRGPRPAVNDLQRNASPPRRAAASGAPSPAPAAPSRATPGAETMHAREGMERLLRDFVARARGDEALGRFAAGGQTATLHFTLTDLGVEFHLGFEDGGVLADLGPPAGAAAVQLKMRADVLDGMLTGRRNAMEAAMNGELSFSGDTARAMTLQHVQRDLSRLYRAARESAGDPGDLASLPDPGRPQVAAPAAAEPLDTDLRHELVAVVHELFTAGLITATGGNVSARTAKPDEAWITPSRLFKGDLRPEILVRIGMDGRPLDPGARSPSSEALMHTAVLRARPEAKAVIHCHAPNATILVNAGLPFLPISTEAAFFTRIGRIPFIMPGTQELADAVVAAMGDGWAVLMQNHGLLVAGRSLRRAADMAEIIERTAEVILGCYAVGREPPVLPEETVVMLARYGDLLA